MQILNKSELQQYKIKQYDNNNSNTKKKKKDVTFMQTESFRE